MDKQIRSLQDDKILSMLEGQEEYGLYKEMLYLRSQLISPPPMTIPFFGIEAIDKKGNVEYEKETLMHTWLRNYSNMFAMMACGIIPTSTTFAAGHLNAKDTDGTVRNAASQIVFGGVKNTVFGNVGHGILVGRGVAIYSYEDFVLDNLIDHGIAGNEMLYYAMFDHAQTWDGGTRQWTSIVRRYMVNRSGGTIGVTEAGLAESEGSVHILLSRDIVAPTVDIDNEKACRVTYTFVSGVWAS